MLRKFSLLPEVGDEHRFECFPCSSKGRIFRTRNFNVDIEFVYIDETFFHNLKLRLPFIDFECGVLCQENVAPMQLYHSG